MTASEQRPTDDASDADAAVDVETSLRLTPRFGVDGTIPAVATDADTGEALMLAYMNAEALQRTIDTGVAHYWSRSRGSLWRKGETSGHEQTVVELRVDCDQDAVWMRVRVAGGVSCHTGHRSCFYRVVDGEDASGIRLAER